MAMGSERRASIKLLNTLKQEPERAANGLHSQATNAGKVHTTLLDCILHT